MGGSCQSSRLPGPCGTPKPWIPVLPSDFCPGPEGHEEQGHVLEPLSPALSPPRCAPRRDSRSPQGDLCLNGAPRPGRALGRAFLSLLSAGRSSETVKQLSELFPITSINSENKEPRSIPWSQTSRCCSRSPSQPWAGPGGHRQQLLPLAAFGSYFGFSLRGSTLQSTAKNLQPLRRIFLTFLE